MGNVLRKITNNKGLFVLHDGVASSIFDSQVAIHIKDMKENGVELDVLAFETFSKAWGNSKNNAEKFRSDNQNMLLWLRKAMNIYMPLSLIYNAFLFLFFIINKRKNYSFIHARSDYTTFICLLSKPLHRLPVIWDCRGHSIDELKDALSRKSFFIRNIYGRYLLMISKIICHFNSLFCDAGIFVSNELLKVHEQKIKTFNIEIIPCSVSELLFYFSVEKRQSVRQRLGFSSENTVFLYSGSMVAYQGLDAQIDSYRHILKSDHNNHILFITTETQMAKSFFKSFDPARFHILSAPFKEMNDYYNAADVAFLIREAKPLNFVASPTKFGEYCLSGLPVLLNETVQQAVEYSGEIGNYFSIEEDFSCICSNQKRRDFSIKSQQYFSRTMLNKSYLRLYQSFYTC
jgi:glycosyltransferase involved in cell wall biosynthesis